MKTQRVLMLVALWLSGGMFFNGCQHDEFHGESFTMSGEGFIPEGEALMGSASLVVNNQSSCIDPSNPEYQEAGQQVTAHWGNPRNPFEKTVDIVYYNTLTHFVLKVKSSHGWADLEIDEASVWVNGPVSEDAWGEYSVELPEQWEAGDVYGFGLKVAGYGPPAYFDVEYFLIGECEDDGWPRDTETQVVDVINPTTGHTWMDRNLGASRAATSSTDTEAYGDLYQWGRAADGHQKRTSGTTTTLSTSDNPEHDNFILAPNSPYDWRSPQNDNLWQGVNGVNNPCPPGYRLPTEAELNAERLSWSSQSTAGAFASPLKLPVAGSRGLSDGSLIYVGSRGFYWSSTASGTYSRYLFSSSTSTFMFNSFRASGFSVRCLKD